MPDSITFDELRAKIRSPEVLAAFDFILNAASSYPGLSCEPEKHGYMSSLRICRGADWSFSVAPARNWLLFYIRNPELRRGRTTLDTVRSVFPHAAERRDGEITVRLTNATMADRMLRLVGADPGLPDFFGMTTDGTLQEVGRRFSVSPERIRQIEARALRKLKHPSRSRKLRSFLDD